MLGIRSVVVVTTAEGRIRSLNHNCELVLGYRAGDLKGRVIWDVLPATGYVRRMQDDFCQLQSGETPVDAEGAWQSADAVPVMLRWSYTALSEPGGGIESIIVAGMLLSGAWPPISDPQQERRTSLPSRRAGDWQLQVELAEAVDRYQAILDTAVDGIITISEDGTIESFNKSSERIFGYRATEVIGSNVSVLMPAPYREEHDSYVDNYLRTRRRQIIGIGREVEGLRKDGTVFPLELAVAEVVLSSRRLFMGSVRDISDRRQAEAEARQRLDELAHVMRLHSMGDLASGLAHEVNQPLTAIVSRAEACLRMMKSGRATDAILEESLSDMARQGRRAADVIRRLRHFVGKGQSDKVPRDLSGSVTEVLQLMQQELRKQHVHTEISIASDLPLVRVDSILIEQVLVNLIRNAIDAMEGVNARRRELELSVSRDVGARPGVLVSLRDSGPGLAPAEFEHVFEPFYSTKAEGLGQGLSICRRIITAHEGRIWAKSSTHGATFHFWLPAYEHDEEAGCSGSM